MNRNIPILSFIIVCFIVIANKLDAQFGISIKYNNNNASQWNLFIDNQFPGFNEKLLSPGYEAGLDYWLRIKNFRVEFYPQIIYAKSSTEMISQADDRYTLISTTIGFNANVNFYIFDLQLQLLGE